ncbi:hypothetical protein GCM10007898_18920 [Dyella flagellata]|uniref:Uncharacterized protein n=2 Tax=Dyella flagellata TaxID=1867833 RepID=A0ABQ5X9N4_9GAMM|nr:hypothetical protein GCM10007898_18920 [Dyella flagellata]
MPEGGVVKNESDEAPKPLDKLWGTINDGLILVAVLGVFVLILIAQISGGGHTPPPKLAFALLGIMLASWVGRGVYSGQINVRGTMLSRARNPVLFWLIVIPFGCFSLACFFYLLGSH